MASVLTRLFATPFALLALAACVSPQDVRAAMAEALDAVEQSAELSATANADLQAAISDLRTAPTPAAQDDAAARVEAALQGQAAAIERLVDGVAEMVDGVASAAGDPAQAATDWTHLLLTALLGFGGAGAGTAAVGRQVVRRARREAENGHG